MKGARARVRTHSAMNIQQVRALGGGERERRGPRSAAGRWGSGLWERSRAEKGALTQATSGWDYKQNSRGRHSITREAKEQERS